MAAPEFLEEAAKQLLEEEWTMVTDDQAARADHAGGDRSPAPGMTPGIPPHRAERTRPSEGVNVVRTTAMQLIADAKGQVGSVPARGGRR